MGCRGSWIQYIVVFLKVAPCQSSQIDSRCLRHWRQPSLLLYNGRLDFFSPHLHLNNIIINCLFFFFFMITNVKGQNYFGAGQRKTATISPSPCKGGRRTVRAMQNRSQPSDRGIIGGHFFSLKCKPNGSSNRELVP